MNKKTNHKQIYDTCKNHMHAYVLIETADGQKYDGIITGLDDQHVYLAVPLEDERGEERQFGSSYGGSYYGGSPGYGSYGGYGGYGGSPYYGSSYPPRRFRRFVLPLTALAALSLLPWY